MQATAIREPNSRVQILLQINMRMVALNDCHAYFWPPGVGKIISDYSQIIISFQPSIQLILEEIYSLESSSYLGKGSHYHALSIPEIQQVDLLSTASTTRILKHQHIFYLLISKNGRVSGGALW